MAAYMFLELNDATIRAGEISAAAMLDRRLHHAHIVQIKRDSYRPKDKSRAGLLIANNAKPD